MLDQLDRASTSIVLNVAEGGGKFSPRDRLRYYDIARGSALECAACLDILRVKQRLDDTGANQGKAIIKEIVSMLVGLSKSIDPDRFRECGPTYGSDEQILPMTEQARKVQV